METKQNQNPDLERLRIVMLLAREDAKIADDKYLLAREAFHAAEIREKEITEMAESAGQE